MHQIDNDKRPMIRGMRTKIANRFRLLQDSSSCLRPLSFAFSNEVHRRSCHCRVPGSPGVPPGLPSMLVAPPKWETSRLSSSENSVVTCDPTALPGCSAITKIQ